VAPALLALSPVSDAALRRLYPSSNPSCEMCHQYGTYKLDAGSRENVLIAKADFGYASLIRAVL
jgi:hypothetical protein